MYRRFFVLMTAALLVVPLGVVAQDDARRIDPDDLSYLGAFRLPDQDDFEIGWYWGGEGLAYYPDGDPGGEADGFPGSLFGTTHNWHQYITEISIPAPVVSTSLDDLPTAATLQPPTDVRGAAFPGKEWELPRAALAYLPALGDQAEGMLYFAHTMHLAESVESVPSHGWVGVDLQNPAGPWRLPAHNYLTTDYMFPIPAAWAEEYVGGMRLATGRYRDGGQGSQGPTLFAIAPWQDGNPPESGAMLEAVQLLGYTAVDAPGEQHTLEGYTHADEWSGGAWLTAGERGAVVFVGTRGLGEDWYGFANGVVWPDEPPYPEVPDYPYDYRGWWAEDFEEQMIFYDPADLAAVARGELETWAPQPYATLSLADLTFSERRVELVQHLGAVAFDAERGYLYLLEILADNDKPVVHVFAILP